MPQLRADDFAFSKAVGRERGEGGHLGIWGRGYYTDLAAKAGIISFEGDITGLMIGGDVTTGRSLFGLALNIAEAKIDWDNRDFTGGHDTSLAGLHPYFGWKSQGGTLVWGTMGLEMGEMELTEDDSPDFSYKRDLHHGTLALGSHSPLGALGKGEQLKIGLIAEALRTRLKDSDSRDDDTGSLDYASGWVRAGFELEHQLPLAGAHAMHSSWELTLRQDFGDARNGTGVEVGWGLDYAHPGLGLRVGLKARSVESHRGDLEEFGMSLGVSWDPTPDGKGISLTLAPEWGPMSSAQEAIWGGAFAYTTPPAEGEFAIGKANGGGGATSAANVSSYGLGTTSALVPPTANRRAIGELPAFRQAAGAGGSDSRLRYRLEARYGIPILQGRELLTLFARSHLQSSAVSQAVGADFNLGSDLTAGIESILYQGAATETDHRAYLRYHRRF